MVSVIRPPSKPYSPNEPRPPRLLTAAASSTEETPPNGPSTIGVSMPRSSVAGVRCQLCIPSG
jgi:hypothetical protein